MVYDDSSRDLNELIWIHFCKLLFKYAVRLPLVGFNIFY